MTKPKTKQKTATRTPLSRARVLQASVALADEAGLEAFSMRGLAQELGVVPMALYKHVANKEELLDGMVDIVFSEVELPPEDLDWRSAMRHRAISTREALGRHSWAIGMMESRRPGPANLRNHNAVMGCLRKAGFSFKLAIHAYSVQDAYIYGFALQERDMRLETPGSAGEAARRRAQTIGALDSYPHLLEIAAKLPGSGYDNAVEFAWGLDLILDGLERLRHAGAAPA
ncbi:MAG TPA: TetR/AcrR family transcriptional regulator C-terminal domain-containing protein [Solirubrobacteraceae bacterium]|jgi:AcrR family transcriptional regulator|nr:TetR/AcrR family transcriptional regulator C-terminal domain-containing protein [Solirubrobacteraceae bacterium]